jgi:hypothetical protein
VKNDPPPDFDDFAGRVCRLLSETRAELDAAREVAEQYRRDWYAAKSEFTDALNRARLEEREECAKLAENAWHHAATDYERGRLEQAADIAAAIRARSEPKP